MKVFILQIKYLFVIQIILRKLYPYPTNNKLSLFIAFKVRFQFGSEKVPFAVASEIPE